MSSQHWDVLIVGAGPAGMAAAAAASQGGHRVAVLDENPAAGGQIWRRGWNDDEHKPDAARQAQTGKFVASGATLFHGRRVVAALAQGVLETWNDAENVGERFAYDKLILATGARERFLPFPGWTLPGVFGAGGLQALVRNGYDVRGKRVAVAGTGPLLMAIAAHLQEDGAKVLSICEQAPLSQLVSFATALLKRPGKILQGLSLRSSLRGVAYRTGSWPVAAYGAGQLEKVEFTDGKRRWEVDCDLLACGFHLVPNIELPALLGCALEDGCVRVDALQRTSVEHVFCAGEPTGVAGVDAALLQGEAAGLMAIGLTAQAQKLSARVASERGFGAAMEKAFRLRTEVLQMAAKDTIVCRCEDVCYGDLKALADGQNTWTDAKLQKRCGMGPCQGRVCGPAVEALFGWKNASVRPPIFPLPISALSSEPQLRTDSNSAALQEIQ
ncbi:MAG: FAD/NAD(P)-binding oxidoreductase [Acidobacteriaceae bacterium]|nr:FAD/NAD(P)-binding oxidoreductase [Acidobacteriaceae bacterium]